MKEETKDVKKTKKTQKAEKTEEIKETQEKQEKAEMRKHNMRVFPFYKALAWDFLFYYTIDFLFFTQVKGMSAAIVILKDSFYALSKTILQIPANFIVETLGRKNSIILGNILNCIYMIIIILSRNLGDLIFAVFIEAIAFSIKGIAEPSLLGSSIPASKYKSKIYSKINARGASGYFILDSISKIIAGFLFQINGYAPISCALAVLIIVTIISIGFIEPIKKKKITSNTIFDKQQLKNIKDGFIYVLKSERLKALIICSALLETTIVISSSYYVSLFKDLQIPSVVIGAVAAIGGIISAVGSRKQDWVHKNLRNKTLITISFLLSFGMLTAGISGIFSKEASSVIAIVFIGYIMYYFSKGLYYVVIDKYLSNFANHKIDTKIFAASNLITSTTRGIGMLFAAFLIDKISTAYCMIAMGSIFAIIYAFVGKYMSTRVGLKAEEYSKEETRYDELKLIEEEALSDASRKTK